MRELKPGARPIAYMERDDVAISAADSRLMAFKSVDESLRFWIKVFLLFALEFLQKNSHVSKDFSCLSLLS